MYEHYQVIVFKDRIFELYKLSGDNDYSLYEVLASGNVNKVGSGDYPPNLLSELYEWTEKR